MSKKAKPEIKRIIADAHGLSESNHWLKRDQQYYDEIHRRASALCDAKICPWSGPGDAKLWGVVPRGRMKNTKPTDYESGVPNVYFESNIWLEGKSITLGCFRTILEAAVAFDYAQTYLRPLLTAPSGKPVKINFAGTPSDCRFFAPLDSWPRSVPTEALGLPVSRPGVGFQVPSDVSQLIAQIRTNESLIEMGAFSNSPNTRSPPSEMKHLTSRITPRSVDGSPSSDASNKTPIIATPPISATNRTSRKSRNSISVPCSSSVTPVVKTTRLLSRRRTSSMTSKDFITYNDDTNFDSFESSPESAFVGVTTASFAHVPSSSRFTTVDATVRNEKRKKLNKKFVESVQPLQVGAYDIVSGAEAYFSYNEQSHKEYYGVDAYNSQPEVKITKRKSALKASTVFSKNSSSLDSHCVAGMSSTVITSPDTSNAASVLDSLREMLKKDAEVSKSFSADHSVEDLPFGARAAAVASAIEEAAAVPLDTQRGVPEKRARNSTSSTNPSRSGTPNRRRGHRDEPVHRVTGTFDAGRAVIDMLSPSVFNSMMNTPGRYPKKTKSCVAEMVSVERKTLGSAVRNPTEKEPSFSPSCNTSAISLVGLSMGGGSNLFSDTPVSKRILSSLSEVISVHSDSNIRHNHAYASIVAQ